MFMHKLFMLSPNIHQRINTLEQNTLNVNSVKLPDDDLTGKKNKLRVYYLSWLRNKILHNDPEVEKKQGWTTVGDLEGCVHYKVGRLRPVFSSIAGLFFYTWVSLF